MKRDEKILYHQIHPLKLGADISGSILSTYLMWNRRFWLSMLAAFAPAVLGSMLVLRFADLEKLKQSTIGKYIHSFMNPQVEAWRFAGQIIMWVGAWYHRSWLIPAGFATTVAAWLSGLWQTR